MWAVEASIVAADVVVVRVTDSPAGAPVSIHIPVYCGVLDPSKAKATSILKRWPVYWCCWCLNDFKFSNLPYKPCLRDCLAFNIYEEKSGSGLLFWYDP